MANKKVSKKKAVKKAVKKPLTTSQRKSAQREREQKEGFFDVSIKMHQEDKEKFKSLEARLLKKRNFEKLCRRNSD